MTDPPLTIIRPPKRWPGSGLGEMWRMRRAVIVLSKRLFKSRYQPMVFGALWVLLEPILLTVLITVFLGLVLDRGDRGDLPYPVFLFIAWVTWRPFSRVVNQGGSSIRGNGPLLARIYVPRAFFPLSVALVSIIDLVFLALALIPLLFYNGISPGIGLLALPAVVGITYAFGLGLAFASSAIGMDFPDMDFIRPLFVRAGFWLSPVLYSSLDVPEEWRTLYYLNPLAVAIDGSRWAFAQTPAPPPEAWLLGAMSAIVVLVVGYVVFRAREPHFADLL